MPFFSIISCLYNVSSLFQTGLKRLVEQSFKDYEIILVDDGSTDSTGLMADRSAALNKNIRVIHQENVGLGAARNAGIMAATGRYLCFYDMDDVIGRDWLRIIYSKIGDIPPQIAVYGYREINNKYGTAAEFTFPDMYLSSNEEIGKVFPDLLSGLKFNNGFVWNKVYDREFILSHNIRFPDLRMQQDEVFNHHAYMHADSLLMFSEILYDYYIYESGNNRSRFIPDRLNCFIKVRNSSLSLLNYWKCKDKEAINHVHSRFIYNSFFNRNPYRGIKSGKEDINRILNASEIGESANILKANNFKAGSSWMKLYIGCYKRQSRNGMFIIDCLLSLTGKAKDILRHFR